MSVLVVTGTGTGVGKTVATAALAAAVRAAGGDVAVCKLVQTGAAPAGGLGDDDLAEVVRLAGVTRRRGWPATASRWPRRRLPGSTAGRRRPAKCSMRSG